MNSESEGRKRFGSRLDGKGRAVLVVALITILSIGSGSIRLPAVYGHVSGDTFQGWASTPPTIDGNIDSISEWARAVSVPFSLTIGGNAYAVTLYVMNDAANLYLGVIVADPTYSTTDAVLFNFDNDHDGTYEAGEDGIAQACGPAGFVDAFSQGGITGTAPDALFGGRTDGSGACGEHGGYNHFELSHPLNSGDAFTSTFPASISDISLNPLNTVGFAVMYTDPVGEDFWPANLAVTTTDATTWADIVIAKSPPTLTAWASIAPTIDGVVGASEWAGASNEKFSVGWTYEGDVWVMNDASNLYLAVRIADSSLTNRIIFCFDNDNDRIPNEIGDDQLFFMGIGDTLMDMFVSGPGMTNTDVHDGGASDGQGGSSSSGGFNYFEVSHPLNSADSAHDFSLTGGDAVAFALYYGDPAVYYAFWPSSNIIDWAQLTVASAPPDFGLSCDPISVTVPQGVSASSTCAVTSQNGFNAAVALSGAWVGAGGAPTDVTTELVPSSVTPPVGMTVPSTLTITPSSTASAGTFTYRVTGTSGSLVHSTDVPVFVTTGGAGIPDFSIHCDPISVTEGEHAPFQCLVTSINGFNSPVALSGAWNGATPAGVATSIASPVTLGSMIAVDASGDASTGSFTYRVTGTSGGLTHYFDVPVQINPSGAGAVDFTVTASSSSLSISPGASAPCTVTVHSIGGFSSPVDLTTSGAPSGLSLVFGTTPVTPTPGGTESVLTVTETGAAPGDYLITITGTSGTLAHSTTLTVHVTGGGVPGFPVEAILLGLIVGLFVLTLRRPTRTRLTKKEKPSRL